MDGGWDRQDDACRSTLAEAVYDRTAERTGHAQFRGGRIANPLEAISLVGDVTDARVVNLVLGQAAEVGAHRPANGVDQALDPRLVPLLQDIPGAAARGENAVVVGIGLGAQAVLKVRRRADCRLR